MTEPHEFDAIDWHLFLNTSKPKSAARIIGRLEKLVDAEFEAVSLDRCWKDSDLTDARLRSRIKPITEPAEAVYTFMLTVTQLAHGFSTSAPQTYENGLVEFSGFASEGFAESGVTWMEASIRNFRQPVDNRPFWPRCSAP